MVNEFLIKPKRWMDGHVKNECFRIPVRRSNGPLPRCTPVPLKLLAFDKRPHVKRWILWRIQNKRNPMFYPIVL